MTADQIIAVIGVAVPSIISIVAIVMNSNTRSRLNASRVEVGNESSNEDDKSPSWQIWIDTPHGSTKTRYLGLKKRIKFSEPFKVIPTVSSALSLVNVKQLDELVELGVLDKTVIPLEEQRRLEGHVVTFVESVSNEGFELQVGLGAPMKIGDEVFSMLRKRTPLSSEIEEAINFNHIKARSAGDITEDESWFINFYFVIGTIDIMWIAQAKAHD